MKKIIGKGGYLFFLCMFMTALVARAQAPKHVEFQHLTPSDGLSQSTGFSILQDHEGFIWVGTNDGLNKYDGYNFTVYKREQNNPSSLGGNVIGDIFEDSKGNLWIGTRGEGGISIYDREHDRFYGEIGELHLHSEEGREHDHQYLTQNSVFSIEEDKFGNIWAGTSRGLNKINRDENRIDHFYHDQQDPGTISDDEIKILKAKDGYMWVGTVNGLNRIHIKTGDIQRYVHDPDDPASIGSNSIQELYYDRNGILWIGTRGGGLNYFEEETGQFHKFMHNPDDEFSISDNFIFSIFEDSRGVLWVGTENNGINAFDRDSGQFYRFPHNVNDPASISSGGVYSIYESRDNILWVGTYSGGLNLLDRNFSKFELYQHKAKLDNSISHNSVTSFWEDQAGNFWIGTDGGGLNRFDRATKTFDVLRHDPSDRHSPPGDVILRLDEDEQGNIWMGTYRGGVSRFHPGTGTFRHYQHDENDPNSLANNDIFALFIDDDQRVWIGTNGGGLNILDPESGTMAHYEHDPEDPTSIGNNYVRSVYKDSEGEYWIGTYGGVVTHFDEETEIFSHYDLSEGNLYSNAVLFIYEDRQNRLWLGTEGAGLKRFHRQSKTVTSYTEHDGLANNVVYGIEEDEEGNLWVSTNNGLSKFNPGTEVFTNYGIEHGLQSREFILSAAYQDSRGMMYFGGINGFNRFHPDSIKPSMYVPPVVVTDLFIFNKPVTVDSQNSPLEKPISQTRELVLPYTASVITFEYVALDYHPEKGDQFAYKLEGFDEEWNNVGSRRSATYTNLNAGEYVFRVKSANRDGVWGTDEAEIHVRIIPPFWRTGWFYFLSVLALAGAITAGYRLRVKSIKEINRKLEEEVGERTSELHQKNTSLEQTLEELKSTRSQLVDKAHKAGMAELATNVLHNVGNILNSVNISSGIIEETLRTSKLEKFKMANQLLRENLDDIENFILNNPKGKKLLQYYLDLENSLDAEQRKLVEHNERLTEKVRLIIDVVASQQSYSRAGRIVEKVDVRRIINDVLKLQAESIERHSLEIKTDYQAKTKIQVEKSKFIHILINLIKNAKESMHTGINEDRIMEFASREDDQYVYISVSDNGEGIKQENVNKFFTHGYTTKTEGHGFGLHSCANYMKEMGGKIQVESEGLNKGAIFTLIFPKYMEKKQKKESQEADLQDAQYPQADTVIS